MNNLDKRNRLNEGVFSYQISKSKQSSVKGKEAERHCTFQQAERCATCAG